MFSRFIHAVLWISIFFWYEWIIFHWVCNYIIHSSVGHLGLSAFWVVNSDAVNTRVDALLWNKHWPVPPLHSPPPCPCIPSRLPARLPAKPSPSPEEGESGGTVALPLAESVSRPFSMYFCLHTQTCNWRKHCVYMREREWEGNINEIILDLSSGNLLFIFLTLCLSGLSTVVHTDAPNYF